MLLAGLALLWTPECAAPDPTGAEGEPFVWGQDDVWEALEARFRRSRTRCDALDLALRARLDALDATLDSLEARRSVAPDDPVWQALEDTVFAAAADTAACPEGGEAPGHAAVFVERVARLRGVAKDVSARWDPTDRAARDRLYRLLYGSRMATEEVLLQMPPEAMPTLTPGVAEPSGAPSTTIHGIRVHSGDILVSRGGAPTSAFIARGNDYPGNFSHVALVHVDADDRTFRTIESHIEVGVVVDGLERYEGDRKLRVMLLRPRADLRPEDDRFAHRAAEHALAAARVRHIPYDFAMDFEDPETMFCSEVASAAYRSEDVQLWRGLTTMSSPGTARWLSRFGVRHFTTHGPSDLEYDPQLVVVAEWRDRDALLDDHVDNAILDALLEGAEEGDEVGYPFWKLPLARLAKAYSWVKVQLGGAGPVPEGMSATTALRVEWLRARHGAMKARVEEAIARFRREHGYAPPYWELVEMAREAKAATE